MRSLSLGTLISTCMIREKRTATPRQLPVAIHFQDEVISELFSELLEARGVRTWIVEALDALPAELRVVTEPQFLPLLNEEARSRCLLVGNKDSLKGLEVLSLSRPLTEEKVETALEKFLQLR